MSNRFETFIMVLIAILVLMLIDIAAGAYYHEVKLLRTLDARDSAPAAAGPLKAGISR